MSQHSEPSLSLPFTYTPVEKSARQIRLIRFEAAKTSNPDGIYLSISTHSLSNVPKYCALSYVWGTDVPRHELYIGGKLLMARDNLWLALSQLKIQQLDHEVQYFWIDAICINQDDLSERAHQVDLMGEVYSKAEFVVSWLGPATTETRYAVQSIVTYDAVLDESSKREILTQNRHYIASLLKKPYFERMWIVQEFVLARQVFMLCGGDSFWWDSGMSIIIKEMYRSWDEDADGQSVIVWLANERLNRKHPEYPMELDRLLVYFRTQKCADLRDRVYALIGLLDPAQSKSWVADYTISREQLWCRVIDSSMEDKATRVLFSYIALRLWEALELPLEDGSLELFRFVLWVIHFEELWNARNHMPDDIKQCHEESLERGLDANAMYEQIIQHFDRFPPLLQAVTWQKFTERLREIMVLEAETPERTRPRHGQATLERWRGGAPVTRMAHFQNFAMNYEMIRFNRTEDEAKGREE
ncbi:heterokaryon incompatibility protein-domain-containing protein [Aspergillus varians]